MARSKLFTPVTDVENSDPRFASENNDSVVNVAIWPQLRNNNDMATDTGQPWHPLKLSPKGGAKEPAWEKRGVASCPQEKFEY